MPTLQRSTLGFTLIELLTVVGIVAILAGMLLPTIATVKSSSLALRCASNLRQTFMGMAAAAGDNDGGFIYFSYDMSVPKENTWLNKLFEGGYIGDNTSVARCPGWPIQWPGLQAPTALSKYHTYGFRWKTAPMNTTLLYDDAPINYTVSFNRFFRLNRVSCASTYPIAADSTGTDSSQTKSYHRQFIYWYINSAIPGVTEGMLHLRHQDRTNLVFADGHVENANKTKVIGLLTSEYGSSALDVWAATADGTAVDLN